MVISKRRVSQDNTIGVSVEEDKTQYMKPFAVEYLIGREKCVEMGLGFYNENVIVSWSKPKQHTLISLPILAIITRWFVCQDPKSAPSNSTPACITTPYTQSSVYEHHEVQLV